MSVKKLQEEKIREAVPLSSSFRDLSIRLGCRSEGSDVTRIKERVAQLGLDTSHFTGQGWTKGKTALDDKRISTKVDTTNVFVENSSATSEYIRKLIRKKNLLSYVCRECDMGPEWEGQPLDFRLNHINGDTKDQRLENLRWLCPNCNSQVEELNENIGEL